MNWYGAIFKGLITGTLWGLVKKSWAGKYIFVGLLVVGLGIIIAYPETLQYTGIEITENIIQLVAFFTGSEVGSRCYDEWFG